MTHAVRPDSVAVVLMAYGTPASPDQVGEYYTDIRRGRPPTPEQLADLIARYDAIGGVSPLAARTGEQRDAVQRALDEIAPGRYEVVLGLKHSHPKIEQAVADVIAAGHRTIVAAVLAPHDSELSVGEYVGRVGAAATASGESVKVRAVRSWATEPAFVDFIARDLQRRLDEHELGHHLGERAGAGYQAQHPVVVEAVDRREVERERLVQLVDDDARHLLDVLGRRDARRQAGHHAQLGAQVGEPVRSRHRARPRARTLAGDGIGATGALLVVGARHPRPGNQLVGHAVLIDTTICQLDQISALSRDFCR